MKILIAEDDKDLRYALQVFFQRNRFNVDAVDNGADALAYLQLEKYDAAVLDVMMPKLDGVSVVRQLGIDHGQGMISEENSKALGRFIDLAMLNIGGYYIKENRMGTFGYLSAWTFAEDEEACARLGWEAYHVTQDYGWNDNIITAASALQWGNNVTPATDDPEMIMAQA